MERAASGGGFSLRSKRSAEAAAVDTRERKRYGIETHSWREEIEARAAEHGLGRDDVDALRACIERRLADIRREAHAGEAFGRDDCAAPDREAGRLGDRLVGENGLTERSNTFDERAVLQEFAQAAAQGARVPDVRDRADRFLDRDELLSTRDGERTTANLVACERRLIESALGRASSGCAVIAPRAIDQALASAGRPLTSEQEEVVRVTARSGHGVQVIEVLAGTGKTYTAGMLRTLYEASGYRVIGLAPTGRGARELTDEAGIEAWTVDRALIDIEQFGVGFPERTVIVLDEAGMAPTRLTARLLGTRRSRKRR
jgi:hypothetical protein